MQQISETCPAKDLEHRLFTRVPDMRHAAVHAVLASIALGRAIVESHRAVCCLDDVEKGDLVRAPRKLEASTRATHGLNEASLHERTENLREEILRCVLALGEVTEGNHFARRERRQVQGRTEGVLDASGNLKHRVQEKDGEREDTASIPADIEGASGGGHGPQRTRARPGIRVFRPSLS